MITKAAINQRFIQVVNHLIDSDETINKGKIAQKLNLGASKFSEILKKRMNVGTDDVANICSEYGISADWILVGKGEIMVNKKLLSAEPGQNSELWSVVEAQKETIVAQKQMISRMGKQIEDYEGQITNTEKSKRRAG